MPKRRDRKREHRERNQRARKAGFKNYYQFRKTAERNPDVRAALSVAPRRGQSRYDVAALAAGVRKFDGRKGSKRRAKAVLHFVNALLDDMPDVPIGDVFAAIGSPRRGKGG